MAETLGSLLDKLTIVKLKQWHSEDAQAQTSLGRQEQQLQSEISEFIGAAVSGQIPLDRLTFAANKVYKKEGNRVDDVSGSIGEVFSRLADVNCKLWHEQEKVYEFEKVSPEEKNVVVKNLAVLNLERNKCIDSIDKSFQLQVKQQTEKK
ncbi:MAG: hypothetical protein U0136_14490 [Bdellovibrionota bacterium]